MRPAETPLWTPSDVTKRSRGFRTRPAVLEPTLALEPHERNDRGDQHERQRIRVAEKPFQLRHVPEVHSVGRSDQRRRHQAYGGYGEYLDDLVLLEIDQSERRIEQKIGLVRKEGRVIAERD